MIPQMPVSYAQNAYGYQVHVQLLGIHELTIFYPYIIYKMNSDPLLSSSPSVSC